MEKKELIEKAFEALKNSYAPYSNYHVGAAILCDDGTVFKGCNIENASFGGTNCAERSAVFSAYSNGYQKDRIKALAIVSDGDKVCAPCGICRQVLSELIEMDTPIYLSNGKEEVETDLNALLPFVFGVEDVIR